MRIHGSFIVTSKMPGIAPIEALAATSGAVDNRWRSELSEEQKDRIRAITDGTIPGSQFIW